ncbi:MAG: cytochrome c maturation protein CcmE [Gammaproteobacteria bacterium]|nr:cytochrome c maturation protein CcmE [Gammaproteobacteria bacterium]
MKPRQQRMLAVGLAAVGLLIATVLTMQAFEKNMMFYVEISEVAKGNAPEDRNFRVGGLVVEESVVREPGDLQVQFTLTDMEAELDVLFSGVLPDLFREGQGIIAHGRMGDNGKFVADKVLAKHDENYMPPEVAESLAKHAAAKAAAQAEAAAEAVKP